MCCLWAQNALPFPANMAPGGGLHQVAPAKGGGHMVAPNQTLTYTWRVPAHSGPGPGDFSAVAYTYRSTADITAHENAGLFGAIVIERPVRACACRFLHLCCTLPVFWSVLVPTSLACNVPGHSKPLRLFQQQTQQVHPRCHQVSGHPHQCDIYAAKQCSSRKFHWATQGGDADAYVEVPLLFSIQDEGLSALRPANLAAKAAQGLALNTTTDDFVVRALLPLRP